MSESEQPQVQPQPEPAPSPDEIIFPEERCFQVGDREIVVRPLTIGAFKRFSRDLGAIASQVAKEHPEIDLTKIDQHLEAVFPLIGDAVTRLLEQMFEIEEAYLDEHLYAHVASAILVAMCEVNQLPVIRKNLSRVRELATTIAIP